ncbi:hypothetical protein Zmor_019662 [Zophobas morio]|uniref:Uncharacterized protein n=1 Tax=Zophobas morio TaxID=2755281 RepID=A0AA38I000_9CUCU|nr:hypothetical protein Zmor_019662 [Zophobas morio]
MDCCDCRRKSTGFVNPEDAGDQLRNSLIYFTRKVPNGEGSLKEKTRYLSFWGAENTDFDSGYADSASRAISVSTPIHGSETDNVVPNIVTHFSQRWRQRLHPPSAAFLQYVLTDVHKSV